MVQQQKDKVSVALGVQKVASWRAAKILNILGSVKLQGSGSPKGW